MRNLRVGLALALSLSFVVLPMARAGGPLLVGGAATGGFGPEATPFVWITLPVAYTTDGGPLGTLTSAAADERVAAMFRLWADVPTSNIGAIRSGRVSAVLVPDGDVNTLEEFDRLGCMGNPVIYDADGSLFDDLGLPPEVLGFAGICDFDQLGAITAGLAAFNGLWRDGNQDNGELTASQFDEVLAHEFGHFLGLEHSQVNFEVLLGEQDNCALDDLAGLPLMFPIAACQARSDVGLPTLAPDDVAWISFLYPDPGLFPEPGSISGQITFSDGLSGLQAANVVARQVDDPATPTINESRRNAVSAVSGFLFAGNPGNPLGLPRDPFGSTDPELKGFYVLPGLSTGVNPTVYHVEVEELFFFIGRAFPFPLPGPPEFFGGPESASDDPAVAEDISVVAGISETGKNIILNGTPPRFDAFDLAARNDNRASASPIALGTHLASLSPYDEGGADEDFYAFSATAGTPMTIEIFSSRAPFNSSMDSILEILDADGGRPSTCRPRGLGGAEFNQPCLNDDFDFLVGLLDSRLEFNPPSTGTFFIHVSEFSGEARPDFEYQLAVSVGIQAVPQLQSDNFAEAITILDTPFSSTQDASQASTESTDPSPSGCGLGDGRRNRTVWYRFTAPSDGAVTADTFGSVYDTVLSVWTGAPGSFSQVACNDDAGGTFQSQVSFPALAGRTYHFMISSFGSFASILVFHFNFETTASPLPASNRVALIPHSASGGGFLTRLLISNLSSHGNPVIIHRVTQNGVLIQRTSAFLDPGGALQLADSADTREQSLTMHWFAVGSAGGIAASVLFDFDSAALGLQEHFRTAVGAAATAPLAAFTTPIRVATQEVTLGLALANPHNTANTLRLTLLAEDGSVLAQDSLTLGPFAQTAFSLQDREAFRDLILAGPEFVGALAIRTTNPALTVAAMVIGNNLRQLYSLPVSLGVAQ